MIFIVMFASSALAADWLRAENTAVAYANFYRLTEVELCVINRIFNTDKQVVGWTIKRFN